MFHQEHTLAATIFVLAEQLSLKCMWRVSYMHVMQNQEGALSCAKHSVQVPGGDFESSLWYDLPSTKSVLWFAGCRFTTYDQHGIRMLAQVKRYRITFETACTCQSLWFTGFNHDDYAFRPHTTWQVHKQLWPSQQACRVVSNSYKPEYSVTGCVCDCMSLFSHLQNWPFCNASKILFRVP